MAAYILRRILLMIPTLLGIMAISFAVIQFAPGGPVEQVIAKLTGQAGGDPLRPRRSLLGLEAFGGVAQKVAEEDVVGGEKAVLLAVEQFVEGLAGDAGDADHVDDPGLRVATLGDDLDHRLVYAVALGFGYRLPR